MYPSYREWFMAILVIGYKLNPAMSGGKQPLYDNLTKSTK